MNMVFQVNDTLIKLIQGDILKLEVDAVINPANTQLAHGGGLAGKIVEQGGYIIQKESDELAPINAGDAVITTAGSLPARYVIHTPGPVQGEGREDKKIYRAFSNVLKLASEKRLASIALPAVSAGIFRYPAEKCAHFMRKALYDFLEAGPTTLREIMVCLYSQAMYDVFLAEFNR